MEHSWYILFHTHTEGMALYHLLRDNGIAARISPAPRIASVSCGMSLLIEEQDIDNIKKIISETGAEFDRVIKLPKQIDPKRDLFC